MPGGAGVTRRGFVKSAGAAAVAPWVLSGPSWGRQPPSERITLALIGCGGMGNANLREFLRQPGTQVLAVCDPDRSRRAAARRTVEEHYAGETATGSYRGCAGYNDPRDVIGRRDIDAVIIATPDHWHAPASALAARAGKDIYCEKPLTVTVGEGRRLSDAIERHARVFQTGSQQRSDARFRRACELVRNGRIGVVHTVTCGLPPGQATGDVPPEPVPEGFDYDLWLGPAPWAPYCEKRCHYNFRFNFDYSGGKLTDWGAHHIDIAQWGLGTVGTGPVEFQGRGEFPREGIWNTAVNYRFTATYAGGTRLVVTNDAPNGVRFEGSDGQIFVTRGRIEAEPAWVLDEQIGPTEERLYVSDNHRRNFLECVRSRAEPIAPVEQAHRSISIAHLGNVAMRLGRRVRWDPATERAVGDATADRMLDRAMREPWSI